MSEETKSRDDASIVEPLQCKRTLNMAMRPRRRFDDLIEWAHQALLWYSLMLRQGQALGTTTLPLYSHPQNIMMKHNSQHRPVLNLHVEKTIVPTAV